MLHRLLHAVESGKEYADVSEVWLHVHTANMRAAAFYERAGFVRGAEVKGYYRGLEQPDAWMYSKAIARAAAAEAAAPAAAAP